MDTLAHYRELVKQVIRQYADEPDSSDIRTELVFDERIDHYALVEVGWEGLRRIEGMIIHIDIIDGKIWIQHDGTERGVAADLEELGVPKKHIVLGFHAPIKRPYTEYAVG